MEGFRSFQAAVAVRSLALSVAGVLLLAAFGQPLAAAASLVVGTLVGVAYLFHIATSFNRLVKSGKKHLPLLTFESLVRVGLAGSLPFVILRHGPALGYFTYLAGFVAPLAVAILNYRKQISADCAQGAAREPAAKTTV